MLPLYFVVSYLVNTWYIESIGSAVIFIPTLILAAGFLLSIIEINNPTAEKIYRLIVGYVLFLFLFLLLPDVISSENPLYSLTRIPVTCAILLFSLIFFSRVLASQGFTSGWIAMLMSKGLLLVLLIAITGQYTIGAWSMHWGGFRLHGASNPNTIAQFGIFSLFWAHYVTLKSGGWSKINIMLSLASLIVVFHSLSRSVILALTVMYSMYFSIMTLSQLTLFTKGRIRKNLIAISVIVFASIGCVLISLPNTGGIFVELFRLQAIEQRLSAGTLEQRMIGWKYLWPYFTNMPLTGGAGWWNATNIVEATSGYGGVTSPHSLYVRLLSEVGLIGTVAVLVLPFAVAISLAKEVVTSDISSKKFKLMSLILCFIAGIFARQVFEDSYLVGLGEMGSSIVIFSISVAISETYKQKNE